MLEEFYYLRVYDRVQKSYITINEIAELLIDTIDYQILNLDKGVMIRANYDSSLNEARDQVMNMNFREVRFRIVLIS